MTTEPAAGDTCVMVHGTCVALDGAGVLLRGPSGCGKSDLALRLIDRPGRATSGKDIAARLVADDQVMLTLLGKDVMAAPPPRLAGLLEVRGLGIVHLQPAGPVRLCLVVDLAPAEGIERYPDGADQAHFLGRPVPRVFIDPAVASAAARVRAAMGHLGLAAAAH